MKRKRKRKEEKLDKDKKTPKIVEEDLAIEESKSTLIDRIKYSSTLSLSNKGKSMIGIGGNKIAISLSNNDLAFVKLKEVERVEMESESQFSLLACKGPIRSLSLSSNDSLLVSTSGTEAKLWSMESKSTILVQEFGTLLCCQFLPKDRFIVLGNKEGKIGLWDISNGELIDEVEGHEAAVWALSVHTQPQGYEGVVILSGGADKHIRFWELVLKKDNKVGLIKSKEIYLEDEVLSVKWSHDGNLYAVSTLDSNIRIFFSDSDRLFLSLYGHKFPALTFSFSDDGALMASGSADKSIKVWGMDFGDLHRTIRAHQDSVTCLSFINQTHYLISASKDNIIKYWDLDDFSLILEFNGNLKEVWTLVPSSIGDFFVAGGNDKCLRVYRQTKDQVFVEEEETKRLDKILVDDYAQKALEQGDEVNNDEKEAVDPSKSEIKGLKYGDEIMAKIDEAEKFKEEIESWEALILKGENPPKPVSLIRIGGMNPAEYVIKSLTGNSLFQLENSLKFLHLNYIEKLLHYCCFCVTNSLEVEICCRVLNFIIKTHESSILASPKLLVYIKDIHENLDLGLTKQLDNVGYNIAAIKMMRDEIRLNKEAEESFAKEGFV